MPITWKISHPERLVTAQSEGSVVLHDLERYLDAVVVADALPYAKLFDLGSATWDLNDGDMLQLGARIRAYPALSKFGPIAIVAPNDALNAHAQMFANLADVERPLKIFPDVDQARKWLAGFA